MVLLWIIVLPIEFDQIFIEDHGSAAFGHAVPISIELVVVAAAATVHEPSASLGHRVVVVHRHTGIAIAGLWCHHADAGCGLEVDTGLKNLMFCR